MATDWAATNMEGSEKPQYQTTRLHLTQAHHPLQSQLAKTLISMALLHARVPKQIDTELSLAGESIINDWSTELLCIFAENKLL